MNVAIWMGNKYIKKKKGKSGNAAVTAASAFFPCERGDSPAASLTAPAVAAPSAPAVAAPSAPAVAAPSAEAGGNSSVRPRCDFVTLLN